MYRSIQDFVTESVTRHPFKTACIYHDEKLTYQEFDEVTNQCANALIERGIKKGDRIVVCTKHRLLEAIFCFGILKAGGVEVALDYMNIALPPEVVFQKANAQLLVGDEVSEDCKNAVKCDQDFFSNMSRTAPDSISRPDDIAFIQYTSGSTGASKAILLSHENFIIPLTENEYIFRRVEDVVLLQMPLSYAYGKSLLLEYITAGATLYFQDKIILPQEVLRCIQKNNITSLEGPPSFYEMLLRFSSLKTERLQSIRYISIGGGAASNRLISALRDAQPQAILSNRYGLAETASVVTRVEFLPGDGINKFGSCGVAAGYVKIQIVDEARQPVSPGEIGELLVKGANVMRGYMDECSSKLYEIDEWFSTGDLARQDEDGYYFIHSRKTEMIKSQGYRISPALIEEILMTIEGIQSVAVVGVPHEIYGEIVKAFVVRKDERLVESAIVSFCAKRLPGFMIQRALEFIDKMPLTFSGKNDKIKLSASSS